MELTGKNAVVTGGSRGIGRAIALELARQGANVAINYTSNKELAETVVKKVEEYNVKAIAIKADVSNGDEVNNMMKSIKEAFGSIDILVNNAGITKDTLLMRMKIEDWEKVIDINLKGTFLCTKAVTRDMMKQKYGKIVNMASVVGITGNAGQANYSASKAGIIGFTKSVAKELASKNININAIAPGFIQTDMTDKLSDSIKEEMLNTIPIKRYGKPQDIANVVTFLCSEKASYITGQVIHVDGGMVM